MGLRKPLSRAVAKPEFETEKKKFQVVVSSQTARKRTNKFGNVE